MGYHIDINFVIDVCDRCHRRTPFCGSDFVTVIDGTAERRCPLPTQHTASYDCRRLSSDCVQATAHDTGKPHPKAISSHPGNEAAGSEHCMGLGSAKMATPLVG